MNKDLEFIQSAIKEEIKSWTGYRREIVDDTGEEEFIKEMSLEVLDYIDMALVDCKQLTKEIVLEVLDDLMTDRLFPF